MIVGVGLDLIAVKRVEHLLARYGERFLRRCFVAGELSRPSDAEHLAGLLAAKEAAFKALLGPADAGIRWNDLTVVKAEGGRPELRLRGRALEHAARLGIGSTHLSITHQGGYAAAVVILEARPPAVPATPDN